MTCKRKLFLSIIILVLGVSFILTSIWFYSTIQLKALKEQVIFASSENGMYALVSENYSGVNKVEIVHSKREIFDNLWFVEAHVWAKSRSDLSEISGRGYDNPGCFFLRLENGWVFVPEGKSPEIIALGKRLFNLSG